MRREINKWDVIGTIIAGIICAAVSYYLTYKALGK
jgi:hypothetical protein